MKKILLSFLFLAPLAFIFAQTPLPPPNFPCPIDYKSNLGGGAQCGTQGGLSATAKIIFTFSTQPTCAPTIISVLDNNGGLFFNNVDFILGPGGTIVVNNNGTFTVEYCLYGEPSNNFFNQKDLLFTLEYNCTGYTSTEVRCNSEGIVLPVDFKSFNANRQSSTVAITWTTASEQNNKGFNVQRNVNGVWKDVAFVFSQANAGTSSSELSYEYRDANTEKGISQYRIQQVDIDGRAKYTDIRAVRGEGQVSKLVVYPNPSVDGKVNLVFEDNIGQRDVQVNDMQGKVIKSYRGVTNNILVIDRLNSGFYTIKVTNRTTAASSVQKVVVK